MLLCNGQDSVLYCEQPILILSNLVCTVADTIQELTACKAMVPSLRWSANQSVIHSHKYKSNIFTDLVAQPLDTDTYVCVCYFLIMGENGVPLDQCVII